MQLKSPTTHRFLLLCFPSFEVNFLKNSTFSASLFGAYMFPISRFWLFPHLTFSKEALLGISTLCSSWVSFIRSLFIANTTPILLEYCPLAIILILGIMLSIWSTFSSVVLASWTARIAILFDLIILAILGHLELWELSFLPLMFQDAIVMPFFLPIFDWCCFLLVSWSTICRFSVSEITEEVLELIQNGFSSISGSVSISGFSVLGKVVSSPESGSLSLLFLEAVSWFLGVQPPL